MGRTAGWVIAFGMLSGGALAASEQGWVKPERMSALLRLSAESAAPERVRLAEFRTPEPGAAIADYRGRTLRPREATFTRVGPVSAAPIHAVMPRQSEADRLPSAKPRDEAARRRLTQAIQTELRRVGCYSSDSDGAWDEGTRRAMKVFTDRINATLPVDEPDYILLTLVQGQKSRACGKACPPGQVAVAENRCEPRAIIEQKNERAARLQKEVLLRHAKMEAERLARKPMAAPQSAPVAPPPSVPAKALDIPLRAPAMAAPAVLPPAIPPVVLGVGSTGPAPAVVPVADARKPSPQVAPRAKSRSARRRNIGEYAPAYGLGRVNRPPSRVVVVRMTAPRARSSPFASLTRSAP